MSDDEVESLGERNEVFLRTEKLLRSGDVECRMFSDADAFCMRQVFLFNGKCSFFSLVIAQFELGQYRCCGIRGIPERQTDRQTER